MKSAEVRERFLRFFKEHGHTIVHSHPLIPPGDDPSLLFVNAGMVQFKDVFSGLRDPGYKRATSSQKCLRVSGKHNDLEEVGRTARHHTFFEMLGNFSFGDYFKPDAIAFAWEILTHEYGLRPDSLYVTVHPKDGEARELWKTVVGLGDDRVLDDPTDFWQMGDIGPCGYCSEIHYDRGNAYDGQDAVINPGNRFMELWNLVFMQFERKPDGTLGDLPAPSIDTGMGLERLTAVLQGVDSNYDTDLFIPLIQEMQEITGLGYGKNAEIDLAFRVIADHARASSFLIADGIFPDNTGRGYILRRLIRRAVRFGHKIGLKDLFFNRICQRVVDDLGPVYPELQEANRVLIEATTTEEARFRKTLSDGIKMLSLAIDEAKTAGQKTLPGKAVFVLYDTHGFPVDLTRVIARENGMDVDEAGFEKELEAQRERGRSSWKDTATGAKSIDELIKQAGLASEFIGYSEAACISPVTGIFKGTEQADTAKTGEEIWFVCEKTPFYGESGGQVGDIGRAFFENCQMDVTKAKKTNGGVIVHRARITKGVLNIGDQVSLEPNHERRDAIRRNHSGTHLLHHALRSVLGVHVRQRGSLVNDEHLRFDFSNPGPVTPEQLRRVEEMVQGMILENYPVTTRVLPIDEARNQGALAFFEEKYGSVVRMVNMGPSTELCGGTHVTRTGDIGMLKVLSESGVSAGVRRIVATTGLGSLKRMWQLEGVVHELVQELKVDMKSLPQRVEGLVSDIRQLKKTIAQMEIQGSASNGDNSTIKMVVDGLNLRIVEVGAIGVPALRGLADKLREENPGVVIGIVSRQQKKDTVLMTCTPGLIHSGKSLAKWVAGLGGRGGGNPKLGQGNVPGRLPLKKISEAAADSLQRVDKKVK